jgi:hypothetical protein
MSPSRFALPLLAAAAACGTTHEPHSPATPAQAAASATTTARSPAALAELLARHDALPAGAERDAVDAAIDRVAGQRYAAWSRLYWYTDLDEARAVARREHKPILSLRMLGRLDQDLSCANSRLFRIALYGNATVSAYLRDHVVLHWSSERPVPVARIDFGDGRVLERTIAGNSAHYVLDSAGRPVDVLPGLYTPEAFIAQLGRAVAVAREVADLDDDGQRARVQRFHQERLAASEVTWRAFAQVVFSTAGSSLLAAEFRTVSKAMIERPMVDVLVLGQQLGPADLQHVEQQAALWRQLGSRLGGGLDDQSRALLASLEPIDWQRAGQVLPRAGIDQLAAAFEDTLRSDSAFDEYSLHRTVDDWFAADQVPADLVALNQRIYSELFLTPASDPWLGMATPGVVTGLPGDGLVQRAQAVTRSVRTAQAAMR